MLIFNCTQAACDFFTLTKKGKKQTPVEAPSSKDFDQDDLALIDPSIDTSDFTPELSQWIVHAVKVKSKPVLVVMERESRYAMVFSDVKKGDVNAFMQLFFERWLNNMQWLGSSIGVLSLDTFEPMAEQLMRHHTQFRFFKRSDRSVQAHLNDVIYHFRNTVEEVGYLPNNREQAANFDEWINDFIRSTKTEKKGFIPYEKMFAHWFSVFCGATEQELDNALQRFKELSKTKHDNAVAELKQGNEDWLANNSEDYPDNVVSLSHFRERAR